MSSPATRVRALAGGPSGIAVAMAVMNVATYGYTLAAARLLGPRGYGAFAAVSGLLLVLGVLQLGLQTAGARRIAATPHDVAEIEATLLRVTYRCAWVLALVCLVLAPVIDQLLHLDNLRAAALVAVIVWPMTVMGGQSGILQGERRWSSLSLIYIASGVPRFVIGTALLLWRPTEALALVGVAVGFFAPVLVGTWALRRSAAWRVHRRSGGHGVRAVAWEAISNSHSLLAFLALANADVIFARTVLGPHQAGLYAGGLILVKAVLFLPQFVIIIAFPTMSSEGQRARALVRSLTLVLGLGLVSVLGSYLLSGLALTFIGGAEYAEIQDLLWAFALLGTLLSLVQMLVYGFVAHQARRAVYVMWAALLVLLAAASQVSTVTGLLVVVAGVDIMVLLTLLTLTWLRHRAATARPDDRSEETAQ